MDIDDECDRDKMLDYENTNRQASYFVRTKQQQQRADRKHRDAPWPPGSIRRHVKPFNNTGSMSINDIHKYIRARGTGLYHMACTDLGDEQLTLVGEYFWAISLLLTRPVDRSAMAKVRVRWLETLCRVERDLPGPEG